jgi:hypothetical protein
MNERDFDRDLAARFKALRSSDLSEAPPFADSLRAARLSSSSGGRAASHRAAVWIALAGAVAAGVAVVGLLLPKADRPRPVEDSIAKAAEISSWSAPTDPFLDLASLETSPGAGSPGASRSTR